MDGAQKRQVLQLLKNLYGLKQASHNWYEMIKKGLEDRGFVTSKADPCVFMKKEMIVLLYVDDMIVVNRKQNQIEDLYNSLLQGNENFKLTKEGKIDNYLGVELKDNPDGIFEASQPHLIKRIIYYVITDSTKTNSRPTPASLQLLHKNE